LETWKTGGDGNELRDEECDCRARTDVEVVDYQWGWVVLDESRFLEDGGSSRVISIGLSIFQ